MCVGTQAQCDRLHAAAMASDDDRHRGTELLQRPSDRCCRQGAAAEVNASMHVYVCLAQNCRPTNVDPHRPPSPIRAISTHAHGANAPHSRSHSRSRRLTVINMTCIEVSRGLLPWPAASSTTSPSVVLQTAASEVGQQQTEGRLASSSPATGLPAQRIAGYTSVAPSSSPKSAAATTRTRCQFGPSTW
ncbi:hypothetical protein K402DRAFT_436699 [Aulographum hederae CBS 113979]|uniref:Uncharacterized protein n=1 Tax=Aulographum hederae CBS 113979 TaxID=1176131 RepID=A0A6G1GRA7_9PEZI|nr:hypothetical protein K402DRAFT_436699 [Aulographum hederae CBS 113979]